MTETTQRIVDSIRSVPPGKVASYRDVAWAAGMPNGARQVAWTLHSLTDACDLPWQRIIRSDGFIALKSGNGKEVQITLLRAEGVEVSSAGKVDMARYSFFERGEASAGRP